MKFGYLRQDDDCHWYLVPEDKVEDFDKMKTKIEECLMYTSAWDDLVCQFWSAYNDYRIDGYRNFKVVMEETVT